MRWQYRFRWEGSGILEQVALEMNKKVETLKVEVIQGAMLIILSILVLYLFF
jgi:hypothetical protein